MTGTASDDRQLARAAGRLPGHVDVLAGGVALYATNEFLTISLLPSTVAEIGGGRLYAWVVTLYLVGSVVAATTVNAMLLRFGARSSYLLALAVFGVASLVCAAAPNMEVLIAGRTLQGVAGGLLAGLGYALINSALPRVALDAGLGAGVGDVGGRDGGRARDGRAVRAVRLVAVGVRRDGGPDRADGACWCRWCWPRDRDPRREQRRRPQHEGAGVVAAADRRCGAGGQRRAAPAQRHGDQPGCSSSAVLLVGAFVVVDRRMPRSGVAAQRIRPGPLKWIYLTMAVLMAAVMVDTYVPLFGQRLATSDPGRGRIPGRGAGDRLDGQRDRQRIAEQPAGDRMRGRRWRPLVMASGLALAAATQQADAPVRIVAVWAVGLLIAGIGIGMAWPHLSMRAMDCVDDPAESGAAAAAINTVQLISAAFGAGLAGVVVNAAEAGDLVAARWLYTVITVLAATAVVASHKGQPARSSRTAVTPGASLTRNAGPPPTVYE